LRRYATPDRAIHVIDIRSKTEVARFDMGTKQNNNYALPSPVITKETIICEDEGNVWWVWKRENERKLNNEDSWSLDPLYKLSLGHTPPAPRGKPYSFHSHELQSFMVLSALQSHIVNFRTIPEYIKLQNTSTFTKRFKYEEYSYPTARPKWVFADNKTAIFLDSGNRKLHAWDLSSGQKLKMPSIQRGQGTDWSPPDVIVDGPYLITHFAISHVFDYSVQFAEMEEYYYATEEAMQSKVLIKKLK